MVDNFGALFNLTPVHQALDSMMARPKPIHFSRFGTELFRLLLGPPELNFSLFLGMPNTSPYIT